MWQSFWTEAIVDMKLDEEFFFGLTQRQFAWIRDRVKIQREHTELITCGIPTATLVNHSMCRPETPYSAHDFMPCKVTADGEPKSDSKSKRKSKKGNGTQMQGRWTRKKFGAYLASLSAQNFGGMFSHKKPTPAAANVTAPVTHSEESQ